MLSLDGLYKSKKINTNCIKVKKTPNPLQKFPKRQAHLICKEDNKELLTGNWSQFEFMSYVFGI